MNLQRLIDQHPSVLVSIFSIYLLFLWLLVGTVISYVGGWFSLSKVYCTRIPFDGAKWGGQSGRMRWLANYNKLLTMGASQRVWNLASIFLFRFMHPPLLVPWSEIKVRRNKGWVFEYVTFTMGHERAVPCGLARSWRRSCESRLETACPSRRPEWRNELFRWSVDFPQ